MRDAMPKAWEAPGPTEADLDAADIAADRADYEAEMRAELEWERSRRPPRNDETSAILAAEQRAERALCPGWGG